MNLANGARQIPRTTRVLFSLKGVLLDIDGTLIDSNDAHARAWVGALEEHGYVVAFASVRPLIGMGGDKLLPALTGLDPDSPQATLIGETRSALFQAELPSLRATQGARELLEDLRARNLLLVVATSANEEEVSHLLEQAGVADLIEATASAGDAESSKPDPDIVQAALRKSGIPASHCILIGDTPYDIVAATRARVPTIALRCGGHWTDADLREAAAIFDHPAALLQELATSGLPALFGTS